MAEAGNFDTFSSTSENTSSDDPISPEPLSYPAEDLRTAGRIDTVFTDIVSVFASQASQTQELVRELLGAVDSGNAGGVKHVLQEPGVMVNGTNKVGQLCISALSVCAAC